MLYDRGYCTHGMLQTQTQQCNRSKQVQTHTQIKQRLQTKCMCKVSRVSIAVIN